jgi:hypothetical protein
MNCIHFYVFIVLYTCDCRINTVISEVGFLCFTYKPIFELKIYLPPLYNTVQWLLPQFFLHNLILNLLQY